jgi:tRNA pseudouridine synthase 10
MKSEFEIKIVFEFTEKFYDKIFEIFSFIPVVKKLGHKKFKPDFNMDKGAINELVRNCSHDLLTGLFEKYNLLSEINEENLIMKVEVVNGSVFLQGAYLKFSREIGQSPWEVNGVKICSSSVQDEMRKTIKEIFQADDCILSAGGREDRDVRMLGSGRPFIIDVVNPKLRNKPLDNIKAIEDEVNKNTHLIMIKNLTVCDKSYYAVLKKYEDSKMKFYTCLVLTGRNINDQDIEKINSVKDLTVIQKTPIRVMHRRTLMDRKKTIFSLDAKQINENFLVKFLNFFRFFHFLHFLHFLQKFEFF